MYKGLKLLYRGIDGIYMNIYKLRRIRICQVKRVKFISKEKTNNNN